ncbi:RNA-guided endonuclease InsQ/TnpB family protein [Ectothiorhodospira mobilis]|uniref:RNA-guided endonuclease InsQ/TnpB family protein n=1 Tax=Ectothiorhodospira mobilis TaxID=195064 RepID=UPI001EE90D4F|nr:transposase [Ectothiorhodospira mobilis]MCG5536560.1 transposase [Ectothiorhodospira mobilis]
MNFQRAYRYRFYPTEVQAQQLARTLGCARYVYNWGLEEQIKNRRDQGRMLPYKELAAQLKILKRQPETVWLCEVSSVVLQQSLRHLDSAYKRYFQNLSEKPTFKSRKGDQSCSYMANAFVYRDGQITLAKHREPLDIRWSRPLPDKAVPSSVTITRTASGKHYISILVEESIEPLPTSQHQVGIDLNAKALVLSNGKSYQTPKNLQRLEIRRRRYQRACRRKIAAAKKSLGLSPRAPLPKGTRLPVSNNLRKAWRKVGRVAERQANVRRDWAHKITTAIVRENQVVAMENLNVRGMTASARGTQEKPGKRVRQKAGLNRAVLNVGFGELRRQIEYKALWYGRQAVVIDRWYPSSQLCGACGFKHEKLTLNDRHWTCPNCQQRHDRDLNAARNILVAGQSMLQQEQSLYRGTSRESKPVERALVADRHQPDCTPTCREAGKVVCENDPARQP